MWWDGHDRVVCILAMWKQCGFCGIAYGLLVDFRWPVNISLRMGVLEVQDGVVGMVCPLPSSLASGLLRILNEHFWL